MATYTREQCIEKLGELVASKDRMLLKVFGNRVHVESEFFNYSDVQKIVHILTRTSCEWWMYPVSDKQIELRVRLF